MTDAAQHRQALDDVLLDDAARPFDLAPCGYLSTRPDGVIVTVNQTFLDWTGLVREEVVGRRFVDLLTVGGRIYHETHYAPMLALHGSAREIALDVVRADRTPLPVLVNSALERDAQDRPVVVRVALFDATERRGYERELLRAKRRAEESETRAVALARTLQRTLVPPTPPAIPGLEVAAAYRPAGDGNEVGGDFYDVFQIAEDDWVVVLGDVSGKGVEAAVLTSLIRYTVRATTVPARDPSTALQALNEVMLAHDTEHFCTLVLCRLTREHAGWRLLTSSAGHPPTLLWPAGAAPAPLGEPGYVVGAFEEAVFSTADVLLCPGDAVVLYTDGVTEARHGGAFFGADRLLSRLEAHGPSPASITGGVLADVLRFQHDDPRDDIAVLALRVPPATC